MCSTQFCNQVNIVDSSDLHGNIALQVLSSQVKVMIERCMLFVFNSCILYSASTVVSEYSSKVAPGKVHAGVYYGGDKGVRYCYQVAFPQEGPQLSY